MTTALPSYTTSRDVTITARGDGHMASINWQPKSVAFGASLMLSNAREQTYAFQMVFAPLQTVCRRRAEFRER